MHAGFRRVPQAHAGSPAGKTPTPVPCSEAAGTRRPRLQGLEFLTAACCDPKAVPLHLCTPCRTAQALKLPGRGCPIRLPGRAMRRDLNGSWSCLVPCLVAAGACDAKLGGSRERED